MYDKTLDLASLALDASLLRHQAIATNIANVNTSGYQTMEVNFEQQLKQFAGNSNQDAHPFLQAATTDLSLDDQLTLSVKNATHYRALIKGLNQKLALMKLALHGNNQS
ncbi:flagellar basal body rod protein FlgB [Legionella massiliensis]|uniref:Flagellar basal body rod protein FlgB n=1 Tax=Legionella massiliensis TaxID=1034943 RepID=A0A078KZ72_9GAMM|nr:flagellar basal body protein [Legionella massiliensis]CDZ77064.1 flagellar basal body rod protein FlgB [Legionella massiliensis]CEE12802.1 flagellar basal body rod protein FlgB [Legionella massiliensis]